MTRKSCTFVVCLLAICSSLAAITWAQTSNRFKTYWGSLYEPQPPDLSIAARRPPTQPGAADSLHHWNTIAIDSSGLDHTPVADGDPRVFGEQLGPGRSARAMAIVHVAIYDAVNAIARRYRSFTGIGDAVPGASMDAAISQAAHDTLVVLFPSQKAQCDAVLAEALAAIPAGRAKDEGIRTGARAARAILSRTANDGSNHADPVLGVDFITSNRPGNWRQEDHTNAGIYWAYDGTPSLCAPPRLYNQIAVSIADQMGLDVVDLARLLALVNVTLSDAGIASWESKYYYQVWRPITGIRESDRGTGPTGRGDGNARTVGDPTFTPLGAPASNLQGPNFTPPFPAYPSGHAVFGGALFQTLRNVLGTDDIAFTFTSDELNGVTRDNQGNQRPLLPRSFQNLSQAEEENGQSRIYLGIHWSFDKTAGIAQGRRVANYVYRNAFRPRG